MEKLNGKKNENSKSSNGNKEFEKVLRSTGMLLPVTDDEILAFNNLYGDLNHNLPERFKTVDFIFDDKPKKTAKVISMNACDSSVNHQLSYAARDGQEALPTHIQKKMKDLKAKGRDKNSIAKR